MSKTYKKALATTLDGLPENTIVPGRMMGNSTRLVDHAIQQLFSGKRIYVKDHHEYGQHRNANEFLFVKICDRLSQEHQREKFIADKNKLTIELINYHE